MEDLMQLKKKYCSNDDAGIGTQKAAVGDPIMVKSKGAPKKKKNEKKSARRRSKCNDTTPNAKKRSGTQHTTVQVAERNVGLDSVSISDSVSQIAEKKKRKASCTGEKSAQNKTSYPPSYRGANVMTTTQMEFPSTGTHLNQQMYGLQPVMPMYGLQPGMQPMHIQPIYPMYGLQPGLQTGTSVGQSSCYGLLQHVVKAAKND